MKEVIKNDQNANILFLAMGSNIDPQTNIHLAIQKLRECCDIISISSIWETHPEGSQGSDFLNLALCVSTQEDPESFKQNHLRRIEIELHRVRSNDKNAPRTMDIDILIINDLVVDRGIWTRIFLALPLAELLPDLKDPNMNLPLQRISELLQTQNYFRRVNHPHDLSHTP